MKALSLFSGYGGIDLALRNYITEVIAYVEIEEYAQRIIAERMADGSLQRAAILADVKNVEGKIGDCDIIYGGFPCQDISVAGLGKGLAGERSGLFYEIIRLTKEIRPTFVFLENVPAIRTRGLEQVIKAFAEIGYDCRWTMLSAASVGAPHKRERWFLFAYSHGEKESVAHPMLSRLERFPQPENEAEWVGSLETTDGSIFSREGWNVEPNVGRVVDGTPFELDFIKEIGINGEKHNQEAVSEIGDISRKVLYTMWNNREVAEASHNIYTERFYNSMPELPQRNSQGRGNMGAWIKKDKDLCDMLNKFCSETLEKSQDLQFSLLKKLGEIKRDETLEKSFRADRIKALGNGVVPLQVKTAFEILIGINNPS